MSRAVWPLALATGALAGVLTFAPGRQELATRIYLLAAGAIALGALLRELRRAHPPAGPSRFDQALRPRPRAHERLGALAKLEREVSLAAGSAFDVHFRLRPTLRDVAGALLARRGVDLDRSPETARRILGDETFELVRADRPPPDDRYAPGLERAQLARIVETLESL